MPISINDKLFLDTDVVADAFDASEPHKKARAIEILRPLHASTCFCFVVYCAMFKRAKPR